MSRLRGQTYMSSLHSFLQWAHKWTDSGCHRRPQYADVRAHCRKLCKEDMLSIHTCTTTTTATKQKAEAKQIQKKRRKYSTVQNSTFSANPLCSLVNWYISCSKDEMKPMSSWMCTSTNGFPTLQLTSNEPYPGRLIMAFSDGFELLIS